MFLIHLHSFHQIVLQETFDVLQVFPFSKIGHVLSTETNTCHLKHHVLFSAQQILKLFRTEGRLGPIHKEQTTLEKKVDF